jgi:hypothetical protein
MKLLILSIPYAKIFKPLYCGSKHGLKSITFTDLCGNKGDTITICKTISNVKNIESIIGGYTDIPWSKNPES